MKPGPKGLPGPRDATGRLLKLCQCGGSKTASAKMCRSCVARHQRRLFTCQGCGVMHWRRAWCDDARKYCSRECYFRMKKTRAAANAAQQVIDRLSVQAEHEIQRELRRAAQQAQLALRWCSCGAPLNRRSPRAVCCDACRKERIGRSVSRRRTVSREHGVQHCCPNCGQQFRGYEGDVYCSTRCAHRYNHHGRYPSIGQLSLTERNRIAELLALVRTARKHIQAQASP